MHMFMAIDMGATPSGCSSVAEPMRSAWSVLVSVMALADAVGWFQSAARARRVTVDDVDAALQPSTSARSQSSRFLQ